MHAWGQPIGLPSPEKTRLPADRRAQALHAVAWLAPQPASGLLGLDSELAELALERLRCGEGVHVAAVRLAIGDEPPVRERDDRDRVAGDGVERTGAGAGSPTRSSTDWSLSPSRTSRPGHPGMGLHECSASSCSRVLVGRSMDWPRARLRARDCILVWTARVARPPRPGVLACRARWPVVLSPRRESWAFASLRPPSMPRPGRCSRSGCTCSLRTAGRPRRSRGSRMACRP